MTTMKIGALLCALSSPILMMPTRAADPTESTPLPAKENFHLFLLAGQSNMAGRGKVDEEGRTANPRILSLGIEGKWLPAVDPLHWDKPTVAGAGIGKPFAEIIVAENPAITVGLIPAACGGSPIAAWQPGKYYAGTKSNPYDDAIARAKRAIQDGTLKAILWHQGENDADPKNAPEYEKRLEELIVRFRTELHAPDLPFVIGQLGRFPGAPWTADREAVNAAHQAVAKRVKNVRFVSSEGLDSKGDNLHFNTQSLRTFAKGYAAAYRELVAAPAH